MSTIRTPDQRLRVFISSTIEELGEERRLVREAIEHLRLTPVLFESGARPHPPRELYRAYLDQSDIFIGIYASSYGWVAPDMTISGIEDEYRLSQGRPQLIYIKQGTAARDPRLEELLRTIKSSDAVSYQKFTTPGELADLLKNDLALLLSERFATQRAGSSKRNTLPAMRNATIGRDRERTEIIELLGRPDTGMVTITGTGGTGKSHLALRIAHDISSHFPDGVHFIPLSGVGRVEQVGPAIAAALGVVDSGERSMLDAIADQLVGRRSLVLIDNFEQVLEASPFLADLLARLPLLKLLVTSRAPLHISGEQVYPLAPLMEPAEEEERVSELLTCPSVALFIQRANARAARLTLDTVNVRAIAALCRRLDGLPLAIELAAAHTKYFTPVVLEERMERTLDLLARGPRDLPERQRTMRAAISSSCELLDPAHRVLFRRLAVFSDRWSMEQAASVADAKGLELDPMEAVEQLVDMGLVRVAPARPNDPDHEPRFILLHVMREFALEELDAHDERAATMQRLLGWCMKLVTQSAQQAGSDLVIKWMDQVEVSYLDLRNLIRDALDRGDVATVWLLVAHLNTFWLLRGYRGEALEWLRATGLEQLADDPGFAAEVPAQLRAGVLFAAGTMCYYAEHQRVAANYLDRAVELYQGAGSPLNMLFYTYLFLSMALMGSDDPRAGEVMEKAIAGARAANDEFLEAMGLCYRTEVLVRAGDVDSALSDLRIVAKVAERTPQHLLINSMHLAAGNVAMMAGQLVEAVAEYEKCLAVAGSQRIVGTVGWAQNGLGYALVLLGRVEEGRHMFIEGLATARQSGYRAALMAQWAGLGWVAAIKGDHVRAARLLGAAEVVRNKVQYTPWMVTRRLLDAAHEAAAAQLSREVFAEELAVGAVMTADKVHELAMADR
ncbi:MAG: DUF4062 domain-containing protein [Flavobacteriales bacterium]